MLTAVRNVFVFANVKIEENVKNTLQTALKTASQRFNDMREYLDSYYGRRLSVSPYSATYHRLFYKQQNIHLFTHNYKLTVRQLSAKFCRHKITVFIWYFGNYFHTAVKNILTYVCRHARKSTESNFMLWQFLIEWWIDEQVQLSSLVQADM